VRTTSITPADESSTAVASWMASSVATLLGGMVSEPANSPSCMGTRATAPNSWSASSTAELWRYALGNLRG
jgi:hypothetical protein